MKITKGQKYLCIDNVFMNRDPQRLVYTKGQVYPSELDGAITDNEANEAHFWQLESTTENLVNKFNSHFQPLSSAKWAVKRTPENADVINKWANEKFSTEGKWEYSDGYMCYNGDIEDKLTSHYTEIDFNTFKQIVGIEEEFKIWTIQDLRNGKCAIENDGTLDELNKIRKIIQDTSAISAGAYRYYWREQNNWLCDKETLLPTQSVKLFLQQTEEQRTEEWQPKWGMEYEFSNDNENWHKRLFLSMNPLEKGIYITVDHLHSESYFGGFLHVRPCQTEIPMSEALEIIAKAKGINKEQIKIVE